jgi:serine/threonine-protein kinase
MRPAQLQTIEEIYRAALDQEPDQVSAFLDTACEGDEALRRKVEALLTSRERAADFIETSAVGLATKIIENTQTDLLVGQTFGHYKISKRIGTGGMGEVYLATDVTAGRKAALKLLPMRFTGDADRLKRFQQEARAVVALNHPNILTVYEIGQDHSTHYIASELIEGETLRQCLERGHLQVSQAVDVAVQVASALAAAHETGIVHRDIKPENIMLRPDGYVKVLDFGVAKLAEQEAPVTMPKDEALLLVETNLGSILGTVRYMSPEQTCRTPVDKRTDIWSLGVLLYEMLTGHAPFTGDTAREVMSSILEKEPPPLTRYGARIPAELQQIISQTLRKDRDQRYQSTPELLQALKHLRCKLEAESERAAAPLWLRWARSPVILVLVLIAAALALTLPFFPHRHATTSSPIEKSIAVLPFENLNKDEESAFFAGGVQDEILTNLARIADLKVISRMSVMKYKSDLERNLREIAKTLGVSHVVEGSVQRAGGRVRVNVQLIDARNDAHVWAENYDRDSDDVFGIQSEIAQQIAHQLRGRLSATEKAAIEERPTADIVAYALYTEAKGIEWYDWEGVDRSMERKIKLLEKAVQRDPNFALAYAYLANAQFDIFQSVGGSDLRQLELAKQTAETALRLRPDLGEAHLVLANCYYYANLETGDFDRVRHELLMARRTLPNDSEAIALAARVDKRQNRWEDALANLRKASELDPNNIEVTHHRRRTLLEMRRYHEWEQALARDVESGAIKEPRTQLHIADFKLAQGDPVAAQAFLAQVPLEFSAFEWVWRIRFEVALYLRDYDGANQVIAATPAKFAYVHNGQPPESWADGQVARARGDKQKALAAFAGARNNLEATSRDRPKGPRYFADIAIYDAGLGRKEEAIREAMRAVELMPIAKDSYWGPGMLTNLALVYAWTGERDRALEQLEKVATIPNGPSYGELRFNPCWDDLRGDPRFDKIVAAAKAASK